MISRPVYKVRWAHFEDPNKIHEYKNQYFFYKKNVEARVAEIRLAAKALGLRVDVDYSEIKMEDGLEMAARLEGG